MPRAPKKCGAPGCEVRVTATAYCPTHKAQHQQRTSTTARGYGNDHQRAARQAKAVMRDGDPCSRCGRPMYRSQPLALDHDDTDRSAYRGLSHRQCNDRAGGQLRRLAPLAHPPR